jgi:hypothetical protein
MCRPVSVVTSYMPSPHLSLLPSTAIPNGMPKIEPQQLGLRFLAQTPHLPCVSQTRHTTTTTALYMVPHHLPLLCFTTIPNTVPKTPTCLVFCESGHRYHYLICPTPSPPSIGPSCHFQWRTQNQAPTAQFRILAKIEPWCVGSFFIFFSFFDVLSYARLKSSYILYIVTTIVRCSRISTIINIHCVF